MSVKKIIIAVVFLALAVLQFLVKKDNVSSYESVVAFEQKAQVPDDIKEIMKSNCYDCHSNHTNYPWYASIGGVNWILNDHIEEGKEHLNFSTWSEYPEKRQLHKLAEVYEEVEEGEMPLKMYKVIHGGLNPEEKKALLKWSSKYEEHH